MEGWYEDLVVTRCYELPIITIINNQLHNDVGRQRGCAGRTVVCRV